MQNLTSSPIIRPAENQKSANWLLHLMDYSWHFVFFFSELFLMDEVECLSETLNTTLVTIQNDLKGQQVEIQSLSTENDEQQSEIVQLKTENEQQQIILDDQKDKIDQLIIGYENLSSIINELRTQLAQQTSNISQLTTQNEQQQISLNQLISDNDGQQNEIQNLSLENDKQGTQLVLNCKAYFTQFLYCINYRPFFSSNFLCFALSRS